VRYQHNVYILQTIEHIFTSGLSHPTTKAHFLETRSFNRYVD
jgi:hypothetical protein